MRRRKLKPWVKVAMMFIIGVVIAGKIFSLVGASASTEEPHNKVYHGIVRMELNGKSELAILDGDFEDDVEVDYKKEYSLGEMVTIVMEGNKVVNDYLSTGKELKGTEKKYDYLIMEIKKGIVETQYDK